MQERGANSKPRPSGPRVLPQRPSPVVVRRSPETVASEPKEGGKYDVVLGAVLVLCWLLWSGHYTPLLLSFGFVSCFITVYLCVRMGIVDSESVPIDAAGDILRYLPWLLIEVAKSNVVVMRAILRGKTSPRWVETVAEQKTELGIATYANSISLTPGTLTVDAHGPLLHIHALTAETAAGVQNDEMNRRVAQLERCLITEADPSKNEIGAEADG